MITVGNKTINKLIRWAADRGWSAKRSKRNGHVKFTKEECKSVFASSTPSDQRAVLNIKSQIIRAEKGLPI